MAKTTVQELQFCCGVCRFSRQESKSKLVCWALPPYCDKDGDMSRGQYEPDSPSEPACKDFQPRLHS